MGVTVVGEGGWRWGGWVGVTVVGEGGWKWGGVSGVCQFVIVVVTGVAG